MPSTQRATQLLGKERVAGAQGRLERGAWSLSSARSKCTRRPIHNPCVRHLSCHLACLFGPSRALRSHLVARLHEAVSFLCDQLGGLCWC